MKYIAKFVILSGSLLKVSIATFSILASITFRHKAFFNICLIGLFFSLTGVSLAQSSTPVSVEPIAPIVIAPQKGQLDISGNSLILKDGSQLLSLQEVMRSKNFEPSNSSKPNFGYTSDTYWMKFKLKNTTNEAQTRWLEVQYPIMDSIWIYELDESQNLLQAKIGGDKVPFGNREIENENTVFILKIPPNTTYTYFAKFRSEGTLSFPTVAWKPLEFAEHNANNRFGFGIYYGIIGVMIFYNLFIFFALRDKAYLYYVLTISSIALFQLAFNGLGFEYLWSNFYWFNDYALPFFITSLSLNSLIFGRYFLKIPDLLPKLDKIILVYIGIVVIEYAFIFFLPYRETIRIVTITGFIGTLLLFYMGFRSYRKGYSSAIYFLVAWTVFLMGVIGVILRGFGVVQTNFVTTYAVQIGSALEVVLLSLGLADRINYLKKELAQKAVLEERRKRDYEKQQRELIESQNVKLEKLVADRTQDLEQRTQQLQLQNRKMTDSINYAKRIQEAILPPKKQLKNLLNEHFVLFKPRDIVSGDFYWVSKIEQKVVLGVVDCTGHGVPGAFMSIIGNDLLNQIVNNQQITNPSEILEALDEGIRAILKQNEKGDIRSSSRDGMDLGICVIDKEQNTLEFAGANRPLWVVKENKLEEIKGNRRAIGGWTVLHKDNSFQTHRIDISDYQSACIYLSSDGYQDQFGRGGKKFLTKNLKKLLSEVSSLPLNRQKERLSQQLKDWKGDEPQLDDILVLGFRLS